MNRLITVFIRRKITTIMIFAALCLVGIISFLKLPVELLPDIELPKLTVITPFENAAPSEVEKLVTVRIEEAVTAVSGVSGIVSESIEGMSIVKLTFRWGTDMDMALIETKEKVDLIRSELPEDTGKSIVVKYDPSDEPVMIYSVTIENGESSDTRRRVEKEIVPFIERINGVSLVDVLGGEKREIQIDVDNAKLYSRSISLQEIAERISMANYSYPAGSITRNDREYQVRTAGEFINMSDIRSVVAGYSEKGGPVYLEDVAEVRDTFKDKKSFIRFNGYEGVALLIRKEPGKNTINTCESIKTAISEILNKNGGNFKIVLIYDQSAFIQNAVNNVVMDAVLGGLVSFFILFFFLKSPGPPLIIATALPISMCGTFVFMNISGITINSMSLGGLAIGTGITVDAGIVVLESISIVRMENSRLSMIESAIEGTAAVAAPVVASVLSSVVVFLPIVFLDGLAGAVFRDLALAVSFSILISLLSSLTLVPMLASIDAENMKYNFRWSEKIKASVSGISDLSDRITGAIICFYERSIMMALENKRKIISTGIISLAAGLLLFLFLEKEVMPSVDPGEFAIEIEMPGGTPLTQTSAFCSEIEKKLLSTEGVKYFFIKAGCDPDDNISERISGKGSDYAVIRVFVDREDGRSSREIINELRSSFKINSNMSITYSIKEDLVGSFFSSDGSSINIELYGNDTGELQEAGKRFKVFISDCIGIKNVRSALDKESPELLVEIDRERASSLGLNLETVSSGIAMAVRGEVTTRFRERDDEVDIRLRLSEKDRSDPVLLNNIILKTENGASVPVSGFARISESSGSVRVIRKDQSRINIVRAEFLPGYESAAEVIKEKIAGIDIFPGLTCRIVDGSADIKNSFNEMLFATILSILFIYMLLAGQFQSFRDPLIIMLSIPVTFLGVSLSLFLTGQSLNINSGIGIIMLCGTVVNNGIVLFDFMANEMRKGADVDSAIIEAGKKRLNPILMNAFTTIFAVVPIAMGIGEGTEIQKPLAVTIIGGTTVSTILTLIIIPVIYSALEKSKEAKK